MHELKHGLDTLVMVDFVTKEKKKKNEYAVLLEDLEKSGLELGNRGRTAKKRDHGRIYSLWSEPGRDPSGEDPLTAGSLISSLSPALVIV